MKNMNAYRYLVLAAFLVAVSMVVISGCEYDVTQPLWEQDYQAPPTPRITQVDPSPTATPGVNIITIRGENFTVQPEINDVYFGKMLGEVVEYSDTSIKVRRPNLADTCTVKVAPHRAINVARYGTLYKIDPVIERYGSFLDATVVLSVVAADQAENLYVVTAVTRDIVKVTADGQKTTIGRATRAPTDARIGPDGRLYFPGNNRNIDVVDLATGAVTTWFQPQLPSGKLVKFGDFDANGYFYTGGTRTDLMIIAPDLTNRAAGVYPTTIGSENNDIVAIRVYNGYVYVATRSTTTGPVTIWRHLIGAAGTLGPQEMMLDMSTTPFASRSIRSLTFSANGLMYIATDSDDPILIFNPATNSLDYFYKSIVPRFCKHFFWGAGNYIYLISGNNSATADLVQAWTVYRLDMGTTTAR